MTEPFILSIIYKGQEMPLTAQLVMKGYSHQFKVLIKETTVYFEPDEEGLYRAISMPGQEEKELATIDRQLLGLVQQKLAELLS